VSVDHKCLVKIKEVKNQRYIHVAPWIYMGSRLVRRGVEEKHFGEGSLLFVEHVWA
jgi:hypothetical protein